MDNLDEVKTKSSLYCWDVLFLIITGTLIFMINFYNKTIDEISNNATVLNNHFNQTLEYDQDYQN